MLKNYFIIAIRNIEKYKLFSLVKILGLSLGLTSCMLMLMWIKDEQSYDRFHKNLPNLYRVNDSLVNFGPSSNVINACAFPVSTTLKQDFPEIVKSSRFWKEKQKLVSYKQKRFYEDKFYFADPDFFTMFSIEIIQGNPNNLLSSPQSIVITESIAKKYFGDDDPIEKILIIDGSYSYKVSGLVKDFSNNTDFQFDFLVSMESSAAQGVKTHWTAWWYPTYVILNRSSDYKKINNKLRNWAKVYGDNVSRYYLQPLKDVHLYGLGGDNRAKTLLLFSLLAFGVLLLGCMNYAILTITQIGDRTKEIGMRKVMGAKKLNLIIQFFCESIIISFISLLFAILLVFLFLPIFNALALKQLQLIDLLNSSIFIFVSFLTIITGGIAGLLPSFIISSLPTLNVLKGLFQLQSSIKFRSQIGNYLIALQFAISAVFFICTFINREQLNFIMNKPLGIIKDNIIYIELKGVTNTWDKYIVLKNEFKQIPGVVDVTAATNLPFVNLPSEFGGLNWPGKSNDIKLEMNHFAVEPNFLTVMGLQLIEARSFSDNLNNDATSFILNETAVMETDIDSPIGKPFSLNNKKGEIIGVVKDFHFSSMRTKIAPLIIHTMPYNYWAYSHFVFIKIDGRINAQLLNQLTLEWDKVVPLYPFDFNYMSSIIGNLYGSEKMHGSIFNIFTFVAITISCLSLFALISLSIRKRTKEIAIKKVMGASNFYIMNIMFRSYLGWIIMANLFAWPVSYYLMNKWLQNFAYRLDISMGVFIYSLVIMLLILFVVICYHVLKLSRVNPAIMIRYE